MEYLLSYFLNLLDCHQIMCIMQIVMLDDTRKISEICDFINSVIISDRELFAERMVHLKNDIAATLARNFKGSSKELDFLLRRL